MAPVNNSLPADATTKFVFSVLKHCESIKPNWDNVAAENGIGYARNAAGKFKTIVEKAGYKFENNHIIDPKDDGSNVEDKAPKTPKKRTSTDAGGSKSSSNKKQKKKDVIKDNTEEEVDDEFVLTKEDKVKEEEAQEENSDEVIDEGEQV